MMSNTKSWMDDKSTALRPLMETGYHSAEVTSHISVSYQCMGYDLDFVNSLKQREQLCTRCCKVTKDPTVGSCGHIYCKQYIDKLKEYASSEGITSADFLCDGIDCCTYLNLKEMRQDRVKAKEIGSLQVFCSNEGCALTIPLAQFSKHSRITCQHRQVQCTTCQKKMQFYELGPHHEQGCDNLDRCPLEPIGCSGDSSDHSPAGHTLLVLSAHENFEYKSMTAKEMKLMAETKREQAISYSNLLEEAKSPDTRLELKKDLRQNLETCNETLKRAADDSKFFDLRYKELCKSKTRLSNMLEKINHMQARSKNIQDSFEKTLETVQGHHHTKTKDGVFIWKFANYSHKRSDALMGKNKRIMSPPFFTHENGYKFRLIVYPNGDGTGESQFISVFIAMQPTPYDDRLVYPLSGMIHLSVMNLRTQQPDHTMKFKTDLSPTAFQRPRNGPNSSTGIPRLLSISDLSNRDDYIPNDDLFFVVQIIPAESCKRPLHSLTLIEDGVEDSTKQLKKVVGEKPEILVSPTDDLTLESKPTPQTEPHKLPVE